MLASKYYVTLRINMIPPVLARCYSNKQMTSTYSKETNALDAQIRVVCEIAILSMTLHEYIRIYLRLPNLGENQEMVSSSRHILIFCARNGYAYCYDEFIR